MLETGQIFCTTTTTESLTWFRCTKTDRKCDGYLVPQTRIFESTTKRERAKLTPNSLVLSYGTLEEQRSPKYFSEKISTLISNYSSPCLWKSLVLQATWGNVAVKHALVAIALLHRDLKTLAGQMVEPTQRSIFTTMQLFGPYLTRCKVQN
jgi:hypothetical protein